MKMKFADVKGMVYSEKGFRFGGYRTEDFINIVSPLESKRPEVIQEIIAEAHYVFHWLHNFSELGFFIGIVFYKSFWLACLFFLIAYLLEYIRFYLFHSSIIIAYISLLWDKLRIPLFLLGGIYLWSSSRFLSICLFVFIGLQCFRFISVILMLPLSTTISTFIYKKLGAHWNNYFALALEFAINRWKFELFPADRFQIDENVE